MTEEPPKDGTIPESGNSYIVITSYLTHKELKMSKLKRFCF